MEYTIGQVSAPFGLPVSTLRYYHRQRLFPYMQRVSGVRRFGEQELEALRVIECLKKSGLEWCAQGSGIYPQRRALFQKPRAAAEAEIARMERVLDMLKFKCGYYEQAIRDGGEERLAAMRPEDMPPDIRADYENTHRPAETSTS